MTISNLIDRVRMWLLTKIAPPGYVYANAKNKYLEGKVAQLEYKMIQYRCRARAAEAREEGFNDPVSQG